MASLTYDDLAKMCLYWEELIPLYQDSLSDHIKATLPDHIRSKFGPGVESWSLNFNRTSVSLVIRYKKNTNAG